MGRDCKELERRHLEIFLEISGLAPRVSEIIESERPDFLFSVRDVGRVALEHTQPRDAVRASHNRLLVDMCQAIRRELEERKLSLWVHLTIGLGEAQALATRLTQQSALARDLVAMIAADRMNVATRWVEYEYEHLLNSSSNLSPLLQVHASEGERPIATWGFKPLDDRLALLEAAIIGKAQKLDDYRRHVRADEFWLLIVSGPGLGCLPAQLAPALRFRRTFRQIHVIDEYAQHWFQLTGD